MTLRKTRCAIILTLCALTSSQAQTVAPDPMKSEARPELAYVETHKDGSIILTINGERHRAFNAERVQGFAETKLDLKACQDAAGLQAERQRLLEKEAELLRALNAEKQSRVESLERIVAQLSAGPKRSRWSGLVETSLRFGEYAWRIYATVK
jgi:hypothetical protein